MTKDLERRALSHLVNLPLNSVNVRQLFAHSDILIPFVGAGLSSDFDIPPWYKLLEDIAENAGLSEEARSYIANGDYEEAAELICKSLPNQFNDKLLDTFSTQPQPGLLAASAVRHIPTIARGTVITTNFDCVLEAAFKHTNRPFDRVYSGPCIRDASRAVHLNERCLLKLHGDYRDSENRILTLTEYIREYGGATPDDINIELDLPKVLSQALASRPFLFLGCSLKTDRTIGVISRLAKRYPNIVHFALLSSEEAVTTRLEQLDSWNIRPLFFQSGHFEQIEKFLSCLAQHCRQQAALSLEDMAIEAQHVSPQRELRLNGYKAFYFRRTRKLGIRALSALSKVPEREIRRLERVRMKGNHLGSHCFAMCEPEILRKIENALECHGKLIAGQPDDFLTMYMLYYQQCRGTSINTEKDEDQLNLSFETKAVVFDFDGTLTVRTDDETTWEKI